MQVKEEQGRGNPWNAGPSEIPEEQGHQHLSEALPQYLDPETEYRLRGDMALIYDQQPEWLRQQIEGELRSFGVRNEGRVTTRDANILTWRDYRLKVSQVTALFGVSGMSNVVRICLGQGTDEETTRATG